MMNKRSQITIFIIIGIILLFSTALIAYIRGQVIEAQVREFAPVVEEVPLEAQPIKNYIENCLEQVGKEAVQLIGEQGGWIDYEDLELNGGEIFRDIPVLAAEGDLTPGLNPAMKVPYWNYMSTSNRVYGDMDCGSKIPPLESPEIEGRSRSLQDKSIEAQVDRYINKNLNRCLDNFAPFRKEQITVEPTDDIVTTTIVTKEDVAISVRYPHEIRREGSTTDISLFNVILPVDLRKIYSFAYDVAKFEKESQFLEKNLMGFLELYMGVDSEKLPPQTTRIALDPSNFVIWILPDVENMLKPMLSTVASKTRIYESQNPGFMYVDDTSVLGQMVQGQELIHLIKMEDLLTYPDYGDISANFFYLSEPIFLQITPSNGMVIMPDTINFDFKIGQFTQLQYGFNYELSYPLVVAMRDDSAFNGEGFSFQYALELNVRKGRPFNCSRPLIGRNITRMNLFGDPTTWNSGEITIIAIDDKTKESIEGVQVKFMCGEQLTTVVGATERTLQRNPASGELEDLASFISQFPVCRNGGRLNLFKPKYLGLTIPFNTYAANKPAFKTVYLTQ